MQVFLVYHTFHPAYNENSIPSLRPSTKKKAGVYRRWQYDYIMWQGFGLRYYQLLIK